MRPESFRGQSWQSEDDGGRDFEQLHRDPVGERAASPDTACGDDRDTERPEDAERFLV